MPRATKTRPKLDPTKTYVAWEPISVAGRTFRRGSRVRGDDPILREIGWAFVEDGASDEELTALAVNHYRDEAAAHRPPPAPEPPPALRDEDAVVATREVDVEVWSVPSVESGHTLTSTGGINPGDRVPKDDPVVRKNPSAFVSVTNGIERSQAVVALSTLRAYEPETGEERVVYAGQWMRRSDPLVRVHRHLIRPLDPEPLPL